MKQVFNAVIAILFCLTTSCCFSQTQSDLEIKRLQNEINRPILTLPDYGTDSIIKNIEALNKQLEEIKTEDAKYAYQNDNKEMLPSIREALKEEKKSSDYEPKPIEISDKELKRYEKSPCFKDLGYLPGRDNEKLYRECEAAIQKEKSKRALTILLIVGGLLVLGFLSYRSYSKATSKDET